MNRKDRRAFNDRNVEQFFAAWDPGWRWALILGMRRLRRDLAGMADEAVTASGSQDWKDDNYVYGPLAYGITAAAVNETVQHCEDLFALLKFIGRPDFVKAIGDYSAGKVANFASELRSATDEKILLRFMVPTNADFALAVDSPFDASDISKIDGGRAELLRLVRQTLDFYFKYEFVHVQYKHGLKLAFRPFGSILPLETVNARKSGVTAPLFAFTTKRPDGNAVREGKPIQFMDPGPEAMPHLAELIEERELLRLETHPEVDMDQVCEVSNGVLKLLQVVRRNRLSLIEGREPTEQEFALPAPGGGLVQITLELAKPLRVDDFA